MEERERISAILLPKFNKNRREKEKKVERERRGISATLLPKFLCPNSCPSCVLCAKKKQLRQCHCRNRKKKKFFFLVIVTVTLPKMKKKIEWNYDNVIAENGRKKKFCCRNLRRNFKKSVMFTIFL